MPNMSISGRKMSLTQQVNARRLKTQQSFSSTSSVPLTDVSSVEASPAILEIAASKHSRSSTAAPSQKYGIHVQRSKLAMEKLATSFVELNKRKAEKRDHGQATWRDLIKGVLDLQRGKIPLLLAVEAGNQSMCRELLSSQTAEQLKATTENGDTALHLAARRRDVDMVRILVDYGTNVDVQNGEGQTPLHIAAAEGDEPLLKYFYGVRASASITDNQDRTPMHLAAENGHANVIEILADKFKASIYERTKDGSTLMHIASLNGHADCATMLFKKGVYLHMPNKRGARSIHTAARYGHIGIINTLIQRGEKVDITTNVSYSQLVIFRNTLQPFSRAGQLHCAPHSRGVGQAGRGRDSARLRSRRSRERRASSGDSAPYRLSRQGRRPLRVDASEIRRWGEFND